MTTRALIAGLAAALLAACSGTGTKPPPMKGITKDNHVYFPITAGTVHEYGKTVFGGDVIACESCHPASAPSFADADCIQCHAHEQKTVDLLHLSQPTYTYASSSCISCHPQSDKKAYDHFGVTSGCAYCHDVPGVFSVLTACGMGPEGKCKPSGDAHPSMASADCGACHVTTTWSGAGNAPNDAHDPSHDVLVHELLPSWSGPTLTSLAPNDESLPQVMNHGAGAVDANVLSTCTNCHDDAASGRYTGALFHSSLASMVDAGVTQPVTCNECHRAVVQSSTVDQGLSSMPSGFVGPMASNPARNPASGEMRHDAVAWASLAPTTSSLLPQDCAVCHAAPSDTLDSHWTLGRDGNAATFHAALTAGGQAQPTSCIDCHANTRPLALLDSSTAALPQGVVFDHQNAVALDDCAACHAAGGTTQWPGGKFHLAGAATPNTCLPCHEGERPTSTTNWVSTTYTGSPFDYVSNSLMAKHGAGQDCAVCHTGPGTGGQWGASQNWQGGHYAHQANTTASTTCIACHTTQRPDLVLGVAAANTALGFDHSINGTGDCFGCHQATVTAGTYVKYFNSSGMLPGGDWQGGQQYPGDVVVAAPNQYVNVTSYTLTKSGSLVTGITSATVTLTNAMKHTSAQVPSSIFPGPANNPDYNTCYNCHTHTGTMVTSYADGKYHASLTALSLPQPTSGCGDCHEQMRPPGFVEKAASDLQAMDHRASFNGGSSVAGLDCSTCHKSPGTAWNDGKFHSNIGGSTPADCTVCHYALMADAAKADVTQTTNFKMAHRSTVITVQKCDTCHAQALSKATQATLASTLFNPGTYHATVSAQPTRCVDCHQVSMPAANASTQSSVTYSMPKGGTSTNGGQWMNHGSSYVSGKDCAVCHQADAKASGSAWLKGDLFHANVTGTLTACQGCHGTANGKGTAVGTNNNLPSGLTDSTMVTSADSSTGVSGQHDQIIHTDYNVTTHDCNFCHTQVGPSTVAGVQGKEWAQASFHTRFTGTNALITNGTTGRCSNCHMNVKPTASFTAQDHSTFTNQSGSTDCSSCHSWPGTGTASAPNWLGATGGAPTYISVGGFTVSNPPANNSSTVEAGITNLQHPAVGSTPCATCHPGGVGGKHAIGYDHALAPSTQCNACHEAGSDLVGTAWNGSTTQSGGAGDTRPYSIVGLKPSFQGNNRTLSNGYQHFYPVDCKECHTKPTGIATVTTGTTYTSKWKFKHSEGSPMTKPSTCNMCHGSPNNIPN